MKNLLKTTLLSAAIFAAMQSYAQEHNEHEPVGQKVGNTAKDVGHATGSAAKDVGHATGSAARDVGHATGSVAKDVGHATGSAARDVGHATGSAAKDVGHKTAELSAKGAAAITDEKVHDRWGPSGEVVYHDSHSRYFYVDKHGRRSYTAWSHLRKDKPYR